jgi:hypothetical protein
VLAVENEEERIRNHLEPDRDAFPEYHDMATYQLDHQMTLNCNDSYFPRLPTALTRVRRQRLFGEIITRSSGSTPIPCTKVMHSLFFSLSFTRSSLISHLSLSPIFR